MKHKMTLLVTALMTLAVVRYAAAQTAFTYQGRLNDTGQCADGHYGFQFALYAGPTGGSALYANTTDTSDVLVTNGLFTVTLDFGPGVFNGNTYWLQTSVRTNTLPTPPPYTVLSPRLQILQTPYAIYAETAGNVANGAITPNQLDTTGGPSAGQVLTYNGSTLAWTTPSSGGVSSVIGQNDINVTPTTGTVVVSDNGTSSDTVNTLVRRDALGGFAAGNVTVGVLSNTTGLFVFQPYGPIAFESQAGDFTFFQINGPNTSVGLQTGANQAIGGSGNTAFGHSVLGTTALGGASYNTGVGEYALSVTSQGSYNTASGWGSTANNVWGNYNAAFGYQSLYADTNGSYNTAFGANALDANPSGNYNIAVGYAAGSNLGTGSSNIYIGNFGATSENGAIRIGAANVQTSAYIAGIYGTPLASGSLVGVNSSGQLGTEATVPSGALSGTYSGAVSFNNAGDSFTGNGSGLTSLNASQLTSGVVPSAALLGTYSGVVNFNNASDSFTGSFSGNGTGLSFNGNDYCHIPCYWWLTGNANTTPGLDFVGTTDNKNLELHVNSTRVLLLQPDQSGNNSGNLIGGHPANAIVGAAPSGNVIAGGGLVNSPNLVSNASWSFIGSGIGNIIGPDSTFSVIGSGQGNVAAGATNSVIGGGDNNRLTDFGTTIGGGAFNTISGAYAAVIAGGESNQILSNSYDAAICGGGNNSILSNSPAAAIAGGSQNSIAQNASDAFIGGGSRNQVNASAGTVGGGTNNTASGIAATAPGGGGNTASGNYSFAAGQSAQAANNNTFVWSDGSSAFSSAAANQFLVQANYLGFNRNTPVTGNSCCDISSPATSGFGGMYVNTAGSTAQPFYGYALAGVAKAWTFVDGTDANKWKLNYGLTVTSTGQVGIDNTSPTHLLVVGNSASPAYCDGTTWQNGSDRNSKQDVAAINPRAVLEKVSAMPISQWRYKVDSEATRHLGPMAQDFHAAFGLNGPDDKHIATVDEEGVALAAIQGLNQKLEERVKEKDATIADLKARLERLEKLVSNQPIQR